MVLRQIDFIHIMKGKAMKKNELIEKCSLGQSGENKREKRYLKIPVSVVASIIGLTVVFTLLFTLTACGFLFQNDGLSNLVGSGGTTNITIEDEDIPDYIKELIKLDYAFKENSYEGLDEEAMKTEILKAYISATGDLYAEYMTPEEYEAFNSDSAGEFVGVGVSIVNSTVEINGYNYKVMQIISVFEDSPALENDLRVGDLIMYVGEGEDRKLVDVLGYTEALNLMLGEEGTQAKFTVFRPDSSTDIGYSEIEFSITRRKVITESVKFRVSETNSKVGIVNVTGFDDTTPAQFTEAVDTLKANGCEYFVFDMRNNPGGSLYSIVEVLSYFLDSGDLIVTTEYTGGDKIEFYALPQPCKYYSTYKIPATDIGKYKDLAGKSVVLTNGSTASAAELFTATFRDYEIAPIVGEKTFGKGCMQTIIDLKQYYDMPGALRVTTAMYFSKSHTVYHEIGIVPDRTVELSEEAKEYNFFLLPEDKDNQLQAAIEALSIK